MASTKTILDEIKNSIQQIADREKISVERAFAAWYAINFFGISNDDAIDASSLDGGEDQNIDFLYTDNLNERVIVLQAHCPKNTDNAAPKAKWDGIVTAISCIESPQIFKDAGRDELATVAEDAKDKIDKYSVLMGVISLGVKSSQIERNKLAVENSDRYSGFKFIYESQQHIIDKYISLKSGDKGIPEETIQLCSETVYEDKGAYGKAWVGSISAAELNRLYINYDESLFARNIRLFLGARKGGINESIIETAKANPGKFWALNNGITIVADTVKPLTNGRFKVTRFSIVNGCQTTICLSRAGAPKDAKVLVRIVAADYTVATDIVRYNNTQNAIKIWTVRAADQIQERLRIAFNKISVDYAPKPEEGRVKKGENIIYLDKLAQYLGATNQQTIIASVMEKSELFDRYYQNIFPIDVKPESVYLVWILGTLSENERVKRLASLTEQGDIDKVQHVLLGVSGTYWTIYCSYKLINDLNPAPLKFSLDKLCSDELRSSLKKYVELGLDVYLDIAIDTYDHEEYGSIRSALRSIKFLTKFTQKLANKAARLKTKKSLPRLEGTLKSIRTSTK